MKHSTSKIDESTTTRQQAMIRNRLELALLICVGIVLLFVGYFIGGQDGQMFLATRPGWGSEVELNQCMVKLMRGELPQQSDTNLVAYARKFLLHAPLRDVPYNLQTPKEADTSQIGQTLAVYDIFNKLVNNSGYKSQGFFIEVGAFDGESLSNTLWFERNWGWTGLLIESDKTNYAILRAKNRKVWSANVCLSPTVHPGQYTFYENTNGETVAGVGLHNLSAFGEKVATTVYCVPLYTLLLGLNQTVVDYFSLDIEGAELDVLLTLPFDKIHFKVITIEVTWIPGSDGPGRTKKLLNMNGLRLFRIIEYDFIFVHEKYLAPNFNEPLIQSTL